jgi:hypothetical protein
MSGRPSMEVAAIDQSCIGAMGNNQPICQVLWSKFQLVSGPIIDPPSENSGAYNEAYSRIDPD